MNDQSAIRELVRVARELLGSSVHIPPAMVEQTVAYVEAKIAARSAAENAGFIEKLEESIRNITIDEKGGMGYANRNIDEMTKEIARLSEEMAEDEESRSEIMKAFSMLRMDTHEKAKDELQRLGTKIFNTENRIRALQVEIDQLNGLVTDGLKMNEEMLESFTEALAVEKKKYKKNLDKAKTWTRNPIKLWNQSKAKLKTDLSGWKYLPALKKAGKLNDVLDAYPTITIHIKFQDSVRGGKALGVWFDTKRVLQVAVGREWDNVENTIIHELRHYAQYMLQEAFGEGAGKPSADIRDRGIGQRSEKKINLRKIEREYTKWRNVDGLKSLKRLKDKGISKRMDFHRIDDIEFYTVLGDSIRSIKKRIAQLGEDIPREVITELVKKDVGLIGDDATNFFAVLKKFNKKKWQKAVNEVIKEVL